MKNNPPIIQQRLGTPKVNYSYGAYNNVEERGQTIRITEGCPHNCPFCYEPQKFKFFGLPEIVRNKVKIIDMNLLAKDVYFLKIPQILQKLGHKRVNNKVVYYELECGVDYRFLTQEIADMLYKYRFGNFNKKGKWTRNIKIAWDWQYGQFEGIFDAVQMLKRAGYKPKEISVFMICNWKISFYECMDKLQVLGIWNVLVNDCWFDNQRKGEVKPIWWTKEEIKEFGHYARKHNQLVTFGGYDPECRK